MQKIFTSINTYHIDQWKNKGLLPKNVRLEKRLNIKINLKVYEYIAKLKSLMH